MANLMLMFPNPSQNSTLVKPMSNVIHHILNTNIKNLFSERKSLSENKFLYLVARSAQLRDRKDIQNAISLFLNQKLPIQYDTGEVLLLLKLVSGKIHTEKDLNNVSYLGIR